MHTDLLAKYYLSRPGWVNGTIEFRQMIEQVLTQQSHVLDVGAGAGRYCNFPFKGKVARMVGIDIAEDVLGNENLDEALCCDAAKMPLPGNSFDVVFSDYVFEHLPDPAATVREISRVLKPGGYFFVRTPNKWHYVVLLARIIPDRQHGGLLDSLDIRAKADVFPKHYRINTAKTMLSVFEKAGFDLVELNLVEKQPGYLIRWPFLFHLGVLYERLINSSEHFRFLRSNLVGTFRKRSQAEGHSIQ